MCTQEREDGSRHTFLRKHLGNKASALHCDVLAVPLLGSQRDVPGRNVGAWKARHERPQRIYREPFKQRFLRARFQKGLKVLRSVDV